MPTKEEMSHTYFVAATPIPHPPPRLCTVPAQAQKCSLKNE